MNASELAQLLHHLRLEDCAEFIAQGATAVIYRVHRNDQALALRFTRSDTLESARMHADFAIRRELHALGARVAAPVSVAVWRGTEYALDEFVAGQPPTELTRAICMELGETLASLHRLPHTGFGLLENRADDLNGCVSTPAAGVLSRLHHPFPLEPLEDSAVARVAPQFLPALRDLETELRSALLEGVTAVCHSDLHMQQLLVQDDQLRALLDFGDAVIGSSAWDIASFAYFHGWPRTAWLLEGYGGADLAAAQRFCIVLCLHHINRSADRQPKALERLADTLERLL